MFLRSMLTQSRSITAALRTMCLVENAHLFLICYEAQEGVSVENSVRRRRRTQLDCMFGVQGTASRNGVVHQGNHFYDASLWARARHGLRQSEKAEGKSYPSLALRFFCTAANKYVCSKSKRTQRLCMVGAFRSYHDISVSQLKFVSGTTGRKSRLCVTSPVGQSWKRVVTSALAPVEGA